ncbi:DUF2953 domain-containing protein [Serpentinicella sp. ANB-PHB4]|uniref:DUF2953 domain-containing protein n=1 Tax=Serpentinicella sp. ANB-PHB4 TaxID=3074076 RepID=UPI0028660987|nr:DUF2953 domain-containing protein [Serpentinicella sp. ANB-PHB4]MDR5658160.1 DUF2953 domain-containing protein [Serpentinicella sp. ANB-PHB4]
MKIYIGIGLLILIAIVLLSSVKIHILVLRKGEDDYVELNMRFLFGLISFTKKIPFIEMMNLFSKNKDIIETEIDTYAKVGSVNAKKSKVDRLFNYREINLLKEKFILINRKYKKAITYFKRKLNLEKILWETIIGTNDAAETAVLLGLSWMLKGNIISIMSNNIGNMNQPVIKVQPDFNQSIFRTKINCIFSLKITHIITACIKIVLIKIN